MNAASKLEVAETIKAQLGGRALFMLGASQLMGDDRSLTFAIKGCRDINKIRITLDPSSDTYTVQFWKIARRGLDCRLVAEVTDVFVDSLHRVLEKETGLYTSL